MPLPKEHLGITIDLSKDNRFSEQALTLLQEFYLRKDESSPQEAYARAAVAYCGGDLELAQRIYNYASDGWFMYSSPILSNAPLPNEPHKGLPISCFLSYVDDSLESIISHQTETAWLSVKGGGVGGHWSAVRAVSDKAPGPIPFMKVVDAEMTAFRQGETRKGSYAAYLDISHPDVEEFLSARIPTGGDSNRKLFNTHLAINITDDFMEAVKGDKDWSFVCPAKGDTRSTCKARALWRRILEARFKTGEPYLCFIDTANKALPEAQKELGLKIHGSNLCNEIYLPTSKDRTAVCCLSSVNLAFYDYWRDTEMVEDLIRFLDNVLQAFIDNCPLEMDKAKYSAECERSLGLGAMGFHTYLQENGIPFESALAYSENRIMFETIRDTAVRASEKLADTKGVPMDLVGSPRRNAHLLSVAPNANSSIICMTSSSIEPIKSNAYIHRTRVGAHLVCNPQLKKLLNEMGKDTDEVWNDIVLQKGSVQHLDFLDEWQKAVFKTAFEIDQNWVVEHAVVRQPYICQGQSVNLFFPFGADRSYVEDVHFRAWQGGLKGLYYLRTEANKVAAATVKKERNALKDGTEDTCIACQG